MPFPNQTPQPFTKAGIEWLAPNQNGVYGIFRQGCWIYVGRGDLRARLLYHLDAKNALIDNQMPTHYVTVVTQNDVALEKSLIVELQPVANQKVG